MVYDPGQTVHVSDFEFTKKYGRYDLLLLSAKRAHDLEMGAWP
ncbi:uncharacterized protein METZ01_LOCUS179974, partial [marine metagenome]